MFNFEMLGECQAPFSRHFGLPLLMIFELVIRLSMTHSCDGKEFFKKQLNRAAHIAHCHHHDVESIYLEMYSDQFVFHYNVDLYIPTAMLIYLLGGLCRVDPDKK